MSESASTAPPATGADLFGLLAAGVGAWILSAVAFLVWFFATTAGDAGLAAVAAPFFAFAAGWLPGGILMLVFGLYRLARGRTRLLVVGSAMVVYLLPLPLAAVTTGGLVAFTPLSEAESQGGALLGAVSGPVIAGLYLVGLVLGYAARQQPLRRTAAVIVGPPLGGSLLLVAISMWTVWSSPEFRYRDSFDLALDRVGFPEKGLTIEARLSIREPGSFAFEALYLEERGGTSGGRVDRIEWLAGAEPAEPGEHPVRLVWKRLELDPNADKRTLFFTIRSRGSASGYDPPVREFRIPLDRFVAVR